jgi:hypothetical protein
MTATARSTRRLGRRALPRISTTIRRTPSLAGRLAPRLLVGHRQLSAQAKAGGNGERCMHLRYCDRAGMHVPGSISLRVQQEVLGLAVMLGSRHLCASEKLA